MAWSITSPGLSVTRGIVAGMARRAQQWGQMSIAVGASEPYGFWINEGHYWGGRPGRTTPIHYLDRGIEDTMPYAAQIAGASILPGGPSVDDAAQRIGSTAAQRARGYVTVRSGRLRASIFSRRGGL